MTYLDFEGNQLTELPPWIGQLNRLELLDIGYNQLTKLPETIGQMNHLFEIHISGNKHLLFLPQTVKQLSQDLIACLENEVKENRQNLPEEERALYLSRSLYED